METKELLRPFVIFTLLSILFRNLYFSLVWFLLGVLPIMFLFISKFMDSDKNAGDFFLNSEIVHSLLYFGFLGFFTFIMFAYTIYEDLRRY